MAMGHGTSAGIMLGSGKSCESGIRMNVDGGARGIGADGKGIGIIVVLIVDGRGKCGGGEIG